MSTVDKKDPKAKKGLAEVSFKSENSLETVKNKKPIAQTATVEVRPASPLPAMKVAKDDGAFFYNTTQVQIPAI